MPMPGFVFPLRNPMPVDVENLRLDCQIHQPRFFTRLTQGDGRQIVITIRMAAQLQPSLQLSVMRKQNAFAIAIHQPRRPCEMAIKGFAMKRLLGFIKEPSARSGVLIIAVVLYVSV